MSEPKFPPVASVTGLIDGSATELGEVFSRTVARSPGGAQFTVIVGDTVLVDVAGGSVEPSTPVQVFSVSKAVVALAAAIAHGSGDLDLDQPIGAYWPAMAKSSTKSMTARMVLDHSCGIPAVSQSLSTEDLVAGDLAHAIEVQEPFWKPGTDHGYGAFTFGALMDGVFTHALGASVPEYCGKHVTGPTGHNFWFGAPIAQLSSLAALSFDFPIITAGTFDAIVSGAAIHDGSFEPIISGAPFFFSDSRVIQSPWPSLSGVSTSSNLAGLFAAACGIGSRQGLLDADQVNQLRAERHHGPDRTLNHVTRYGSGVELPHVYSPMLGRGSFGHQGAGGSIVVVDPERDIVVSYVSTHTQPTVGASDGALVLMGAVRSWLDQR
jgi:CubicO group peptidase (beta-lactamase class C family)